MSNISTKSPKTIVAADVPLVHGDQSSVATEQRDLSSLKQVSAAKIFATVTYMKAETELGYRLEAAETLSEPGSAHLIQSNVLLLPI